MTFKENIAEYLREQSDEIAEDLCKAFALPFDVESQRVSVELTNKVDNRRYTLSICLKELKGDVE